MVLHTDVTGQTAMTQFWTLGGTETRSWLLSETEAQKNLDHFITEPFPVW